MNIPRQRRSPSDLLTSKWAGRVEAGSTLERAASVLFSVPCGKGLARAERPQIAD